MCIGRVEVEVFKLVVNIVDKFRGDLGSFRGNRENLQNQLWTRKKKDCNFLTHLLKIKMEVLLRVTNTLVSNISLYLNVMRVDLRYRSNLTENQHN